jgi:hypothetical protein
MVKKNSTTPSTDILPWEDPGTDLTTESDNALVNEILGGFRNLDQIQISSGLPYLGLDKVGDWKYGAEAIEPEPGAYWAMDLSTARWGWVAWVDGKPAGEQMVSIANERPMRSALDAALPWVDQVSIEMLCVSGDDKGLRVLYKTSSLGGVKCFMAYKDACKRQIPNAPSKPIAVVQLDTTSYQHSKYGKIANPVFKIAGWASMAILKPDSDGGVPAVNKPTPQGGNDAAAAAAAAASPAAAESGRRRRVGA